jgi:hypothetical protein
VRLAVVGFGRLGLPLAETLALRHEVAGFDVQRRSSDSVRILPSLEQAVEGADAVFVAVPTPHEARCDGSAPAAHLPPRDFAYDDVERVLEAHSRGRVEHPMAHYRQLLSKHRLWLKNFITWFWKRSATLLV